MAIAAGRLRPVDEDQAVRRAEFLRSGMVAQMGGYMNRKSDPPPGHTIMWRGNSSLQMRAVIYEELAFCDLAERPQSVRRASDEPVGLHANRAERSP